MLEKIYIFLILFSSFSLSAQVNYRDGGNPWNRKLNKGPDSVVPGWYYNLGITGIRVQLISTKLKYLKVKYVFEHSPGFGKIKVGDYIIGAGNKYFVNDHMNGYGMKYFGATGPIDEFARALEAAQTAGGHGKLSLDVLRDDKRIKIILNVGEKYGAYSDTYPAHCSKSSKITEELLEFLIKNQHPKGSFGSPVENLFVPLALMASEKEVYEKSVKRNVYMQAEMTKSTDRQDALINWRYMTAAIVLSEYYLRTKDSVILKELQEIYDFLHKSQYVNLSQINPKVEDRRRPKGEGAQGGWGHNPGFEGYGPIAITTGEGALAWALMSRCGIKVDRTRHKMAYKFLKRGTGTNGYTWYKDHVANNNKYADMGRTGVSSIAHWLNPFNDQEDKKHAIKQARFIAEKPESFPDTHASPILGMGFTALGANIENKSFTTLMQANKYWFALSQCHDGTFYYQPNRDNHGYKANNRVSASAVTAFIFQIHKRNLVITGKNQ